MTVFVSASPVRERHVSLHIVREVQRRGAPRTAERVRQRWLTLRRMLADILHELQRGTGGELQALEMIEPERLASGAHVDGDLSA